MKQKNHLKRKMNPYIKTDKPKNKLDKKEVKTLTFLTLLRVLKNKNLYCKLRASLGITPYSAVNGISSIYYHLEPFRYIIKGQKENPFIACYSTEDVLNAIDNHINTSNFKKCGTDEQAKTQIYITECINLLLHTCLERFIGAEKMNCLQEIGQETFNLTCTKLFGEGFEDKTTAIMEPQPQFDVEAVKDILTKQGVTDPNIVNEEIIKRFLSQVRSMNHPTERLSYIDYQYPQDHPQMGYPINTYLPWDNWDNDIFDDDV